MCIRDRVLVGGDPQGEDDLVQLLAGLCEAAAQALVDLDAVRLQLGGDQLAEHLDATPAARTGLGALLHLRHARAGVVGDGAADRALADVVARADDRRVGERGGAELDGVPGTGREYQLLRGDGRYGPRERAQRAVRVRVADQDPAQQLTAPADHQLLVRPRPRVGVDDVEAVRGGAVRVAEGRHVHPEQLQLGRQVGAGEGGFVPCDGRGGRLRLLVTGRHQPVHPAVRRQRALADREHVRVVDRTALLVDRDAAALTDRQAAVAGELVAGTDPGAEHDHVRGQFGTVRQPHAGDRAVRAGQDLLRADARVDGQAHVLDGAQERGTAARVDLHRHQPWRELHDVGGESEPPQRTGRLKAEQSTAHHGTRRRPRPGVCLDREQVLDRAVHEAALGVLAGDRRHERVRAGGQDEGVVLK